jgi:hypothetical protein
LAARFFNECKVALGSNSQGVNDATFSTQKAFDHRQAVDPTCLPTPDAWRKRFQHEFSLPLDKRLGFFVIWLLDDQAVGFSSCDKIVFGERANMHLHVAEPQRRHQGIGTE